MKKQLLTASAIALLISSSHVMAAPDPNYTNGSASLNADIYDAVTIGGTASVSTPGGTTVTSSSTFSVSDTAQLSMGCGVTINSLSSPITINNSAYFITYGYAILNTPELVLNNTASLSLEGNILSLSNDFIMNDSSRIINGGILNGTNFSINGGTVGDNSHGIILDGTNATFSNTTTIANTTFLFDSTSLSSATINANEGNSRIDNASIGTGDTINITNGASLILNNTAYPLVE